MHRRKFLGLVAFATSAAVIPGVAAATAMQKEAVEPYQGAFGGNEYLVRMTDGRRMKMWVRDLGDRVPGFDQNDNRYEAYTTHFMLEDRTEIYAQTDKALAELSGNVNV